MVDKYPVRELLIRQKRSATGPDLGPYVLAMERSCQLFDPGDN